MRLAVLLLACLIALGAAGQEPAKKKKKPATAAVHKKPTPEQVRKFNELEKKKKKQ